MSKDLRNVGSKKIRMANGGGHHDTDPKAAADDLGDLGVCA